MTCIYFFRVSQFLNGVLVPIFGAYPEFNKYSAVLEKVLDSVKNELSLWNRPGQNITVQEILNGNSHLEEYIQVSAVATSKRKMTIIKQVNYTGS